MANPLISVEHLVRQMTGTAYEVTPFSLQAVPPAPLLTRLLTNLKGVYLRRDDLARAARVIGRLRQLNPDDLVQRRDLGVCLLRAGHPGRAIDHLAAYVREGADRGDVGDVRQLLDRARGLVARWN